MAKINEHSSISEKMPMRIFITGCARSGTTLLNRLFYAFHDVHVIDPEISIDDYCAFSTPRPILVGKRTPLTILSVPLSEEELSRQWALVESQGLRIVNIIRDGRDVVHQNPTGPRVNVNRWIGCILQAFRYADRITAQVRYEDLVTEPDKVQEYLSTTIGLTPCAKFSDYPNFVPDAVFEEKEYRDFPYYRKRPIDRASVGHSEEEYVGLCSTREERALFDRMLARTAQLYSKPRRVSTMNVLVDWIQFHEMSLRLDALPKRNRNSGNRFARPMEPGR